ncbi:hypothetical protein CR513_33008, partial [Mucuna pruriens]
MASTIYHCGPWSLDVLPYWLDKPICGEPTTGEATFYLYDTLPFKLGRSVVASHPNSPSVGNRQFPLSNVVDHHTAMSLDIDKVDILGLPDGLKVLQAYSSYSLVLAQTLERRFGELDL